MGADFLQVLPQNPPIARNSQGTLVALAADPYGVQLANPSQGKHAAMTLATNHFCAHLATAAAIPISTSLTFVLALWNPAGSGKVVIPTRLNLGWVATTEVPGNIVISQLLNAGNSVATGLPFATFTAITPVNCRIGSPNGPSARVASAGTITAAATIMFTTGLSHLTTTGTATFGTMNRTYDFEGAIALDPGTAIFVMGNAATASTYLQSIFWTEQGA